MDEVKILLKKAQIIDTSSPFNGQTMDVLISEGVIVTIQPHIDEKATLFNLEGAYISPGWVDMHAHYNDPGFEHKEDLESGTNGAVSGGFSDVLLVPNTQPIIETKTDVKYIRSQSNTWVTLHPMGAISVGCKGENLSEIRDLKDAGVLAFSDGLMPYKNKKLILNVLNYIKDCGGLLIIRPSDYHLSQNTHMHEGDASTLIGIMGEPSISEKIPISSLMDLLRYTGGSMHLSLISSQEGVAEIRKAKKEGLNITCDVGIHHLLWEDQNLLTFNTHHKVSPPYRTKNDRLALLEGLKDGTLDAIVSAHYPQDQESKKVAFDQAAFGAIGQQTLFSALLKINSGLKMDQLFEKLTQNPRKILGLEKVSLTEGSKANISIFNPKCEWTLDEKTNLSKSENSPFWQQKLQGKCIGMIKGKNYRIETNVENSQ